MYRLIQIFFVISILVAGYRCNVPDLEAIFKEPQAYALNKGQWKTIASTFGSYEKSIAKFKKSLRNLNQDQTVKEISNLVDKNLSYFEKLIKDLRPFDDATKSYVAGATNAWTRLLRGDAEHIKSYDATLMAKLEKSIRGDEKLAAEQWKLENHIGASIIEQMGNRKEEVDNFDIHLRFGDGYHSSLEAILRDIKLKFTYENLSYVEIQTNFKDLMATKVEMKNVIDELFKALNKEKGD